MNLEDTPRNRVTSLVMEYAAKYKLTYEEAEAVFREAVTPILLPSRGSM